MFLRANQTLSTCQASSFFVKHLLFLEGKPPRWLGIAMRAPKLVVSHGKFVLPFCDLVETLKLDLCGSFEKR
jgi:hypothetical protein